jgi:hypothetical protein
MSPSGSALWESGIGTWNCQVCCRSTGSSGSILALATLSTAPSMKVTGRVQKSVLRSSASTSCGLKGLFGTGRGGDHQEFWHVLHLFSILGRGQC